MAKLGEGDPRWVVRERADGTNVGNWHWSGERDLKPWAEARLRALLSGLAGEHVRVSAISAVDGDANIYNRKGQLKVVYDLKVTGEWTTQPAAAAGECKGKDKDKDKDKETEKERSAHTTGKFITELFVGDDAPDVVVSTDPKSAADPSYKPRFIAQCVPAIQAACAAFIAEINAGPDVGADAATSPAAPPAAAPAKPAVPEASVSDFKRTAGVDASSAAFRAAEAAAAPLVVRDRFTCAPPDLFAAVVGDRARLEAVTRAAAVCEPRAGGRWEVRGGAASGVFREVDEGRRAVLDWRMREFADGEGDARVVLEFKEEDGRTEFVLTATGLKAERKAAVEGFWRLQVLRPIKLVFGYGNASFL
jgi:activator of HSP90 ATPase